MRNSIHKYLTLNISIILCMISSLVLSIFFGGVGYFFGLAYALLVFLTSRSRCKDFTMNASNWKSTLFKAILYSLGIFLIIDVIVQPIIEMRLGALNLTSLEGIKGNPINYVITVLMMWVIAAFGEELLYRGFFMNRLAQMFGRTDKGWLLAAIISSIIFALAHLYQGTSGVITTGLISLIFALIYFKNRTNLLLLMLIHGIYDTIGLTLIYFDSDRVIIDWISTNF